MIEINSDDASNNPTPVKKRRGELDYDAWHAEMVKKLPGPPATVKLDEAARAAVVKHCPSLTVRQINMVFRALTDDAAKRRAELDEAVRRIAAAEAAKPPRRRRRE